MRVTRAGLAGLLRFEGALAVLLIAVPLLLRSSERRGSISAYHDMDDPRWFFIPLTAAAMMLVTNGLVRQDRHGHNAALGILLLGVVLFDHDGASAGLHFTFAVAFFVLALAFAVLMMSSYRAAGAPPRSQTKVAMGLAAGVVAILVAVALILDPPVFWVEAVGVWMIAAHHLVHSSWEVAHPADDSEPGTVLRRLSPRLHRLLAWLLSPLIRLWAWINRERQSAIRGGTSTRP